jgi:DNA modification methylase
MSLLAELPRIIEESKGEYEAAKTGAFSTIERNRYAANMLCRSANVPFIKYLKEKGFGRKVQLIYADPPFFSESAYDATIKPSDGASVRQLAYEDKWGGSEEEYVREICTSLWGMKELLADEGTIFLHLDWHIVHYMKIVMDEIFGRENFINEIIWQYKSGGSSRKHFARKHDTLLLYSKTSDYYLNIPKEKSYNRGLRPYNFKDVQEFQDEKGWYTLVNMKDVWSLDMVGRTSRERTGYATQKPEKLLELIVESCSREGDICADFYCGSGTTAAVCGKTGRRFVTCDSMALAIGMTKKRLLAEDIAFDYLIPEDEENDQKRLDVEFVESGGYCDLRIKGYEPDPAIIKLNKKDTDVIAASVEQDPLCLIDNWSMDLEYDGHIHKNRVSFVRNKNGIETHYNGKFSGSISIIVRDIFGGETQWVYKKS